LGEPSEHFRLAQNLIDQLKDKGCGSIAGQAEHDNAIVGFWRIVPYVRKAEVTG
jgi:hypothetical protein